MIQWLTWWRFSPGGTFIWWHFFLEALLLVAFPVAHGKAYSYVFFYYSNMINPSSPIMENVPHDPVAHLVALFPWWHFYLVALFSWWHFCRLLFRWLMERLTVICFLTI